MRQDLTTTRAKGHSKPPDLVIRQDMVGGFCIFSRSAAGPGAGRLPFVLVHGLSMSSRYMVPIARELAQDHPVYAPDLPGYGHSQHPRLTLSIADLARVLKEWMDFMGIGPAVLLGNSMGCQVIASFALAYPGRVQRAVFVGPTIDPSATRLPRLFYRAIRNMLFEPISFYPVLVHDYLAAGVRETFQALDNAINDPIQAVLARMNVPTLVTRGEHDRLVTQAWAEEVARLLPEGRLAVIPGGAHVANYDAADRLAKVVREFLGER